MARITAVILRASPASIRRINPYPSTLIDYLRCRRRRNEESFDRKLRPGETFLPVASVEIVNAF
jgi:hypothetical protein